MADLKSGHRSHRLRLWLAARVLPSGYAIWTCGLGVFEDKPIVQKAQA